MTHIDQICIQNTESLSASESISSSPYCTTPEFLRRKEAQFQTINCLFHSCVTLDDPSEPNMRASDISPSSFQVTPADAYESDIEPEEVEYVFADLSIARPDEFFLSPEAGSSGGEFDYPGEDGGDSSFAGGLGLPDLEADGLESAPGTPDLEAQERRLFGTGTPRPAEAGSRRVPRSRSPAFELADLGFDLNGDFDGWDYGQKQPGFDGRDSLGLTSSRMEFGDGAKEMEQSGLILSGAADAENNEESWFNSALANPPFNETIGFNPHSTELSYASQLVALTPVGSEAVVSPSAWSSLGSTSYLSLVDVPGLGVDVPAADPSEETSFSPTMAPFWGEGWPSGAAKLPAQQSGMSRTPMSTDLSLSNHPVNAPSVDTSLFSSLGQTPVDFSVLTAPPSILPLVIEPSSVMFPAIDEAGPSTLSSPTLHQPRNPSSLTTRVAPSTSSAAPAKKKSSHHGRKSTADKPAPQVSAPNKKPRKRAPERAKTLACRLCGKPFSRPYNLRTHEQTHSGTKNHSCPVSGCEKAFSRRHDLGRHLDALHEEELVKWGVLSGEAAKESFNPPA